MRDCFGDISPIRISVNGVLYSPVMLARPPPPNLLSWLRLWRGGGGGPDIMIAEFGMKGSLPDRILFEN